MPEQRSCQANLFFLNSSFSLFFYNLQSFDAQGSKAVGYFFSTFGQFLQIYGCLNLRLLIL